MNSVFLVTPQQTLKVEELAQLQMSFHDRVSPLVLLLFYHERFSQKGAIVPGKLCKTKKIVEKKSPMSTVSSLNQVETISMMKADGFASAVMFIKSKLNCMKVLK